MRTGTIQRVMGVAGSGLAHLLIDGAIVHIESGFGLRQLVEACGGPENVIGTEIEYETDDLGVLSTVRVRIV